MQISLFSLNFLLKNGIMFFSIPKWADDVNLLIIVTVVVSLFTTTSYIFILCEPGMMSWYKDGLSPIHFYDALSLSQV